MPVILPEDITILGYLAKSERGLGPIPDGANEGVADWF